MPNWGYLLLAVFVALGVTDRAKSRQASRFAVIAAAVVLVAVFASYGALR